MVEDAAFERGSVVSLILSATEDGFVVHQGVNKNGTCFDIEFLESTRHGTENLKGT